MVTTFFPPLATVFPSLPFLATAPSAPAFFVFPSVDFTDCPRVGRVCADTRFCVATPLFRGGDFRAVLAATAVPAGTRVLGDAAALARFRGVASGCLLTFDAEGVF